MRKHIIISIFTFIYFLYSSDYLITDVDKRKIMEDELSEKSLSFLTYARNEISARHGYVFENPDLDNFFSHQKWYIKSLNEIRLNEVEEYNINLIKRIEDDRKTNSPKFPKGIVYKFNFNNKPLFYIGEMLENEKYYKENYYVTGKFVLLDSDYLWTLDCNLIPPEFLEANNIGMISDIRDQCMMIEHPDRIKIEDIDSLGNGIDELVIQESPESGSESGIVKIAGIDKKNNFSLIFNQFGKLKNYKAIGNNKVLIKILRKTGFVTGSQISHQFLINRENNHITKTPLNYENVIYQRVSDNKYSCVKVISIYYDAVSAATRNSEAIIGYTLIEEEYKMGVFYYSLENQELRSMSLEGKTKDIKGWINKEDFEGSFRYFQAG